MSYEGFIFLVLGICLTVWLLWGAHLWRKCPLCNPPTEPDPIEVEARRLAEIEIEELCRLLEGRFEPEPVKTRAMTDITPEERFTYQIIQHLSSPVEQMNGTASVVPIVMRGPAKEPLDFRCYCTGCGEWHNDPDGHVHVYNATGDIVFSYPHA